MNCVAAFSAHADDLELHAGGTFVRLVEAGWRGVSVQVTNNMSGALLLPDGRIVRRGPEETRAVRTAEAHAAARVFGAELVTLDFPQRHYWDGTGVRRVDYGAPPIAASRPCILTAPDDPAGVRAVADLLDRLRPGLVLTHAPVDLDPEHFATSVLVHRAGRLLDLPSPVWGWGPGTSGSILGFEPDVCIEVSAAWERRTRALEEHRSQLTRTRLELVDERARRFGGRAGGRLGEGFRLLSGSRAVPDALR